MALIEFPTRLDYLTAHQNFWLQGASAGNVGLDGREQIMFTENRVWVGQIDLVPMLGNDLMAARSIGTKLRGRANRLRVPVDNRGTVRVTGTTVDFWRSIGLAEDDIARGYVEYSDGSTFSDGSGFALPEAVEPTLTTALAIGESSLQLDGYVGRNAKVGARFSINDFLYEVTGNDDGLIQFDPPARSAAPAGTTVHVSQPIIQVRLAADDGWRPFINHTRITADMTVNVIEAFDR